MRRKASARFWGNGRRAGQGGNAGRQVHQAGALDIMKAMKRPSKTRTQTAPSVRQSVTIPAKLAIEVGRVAKKKHLTMSRALVVLAQRGVEAEATARASLNATYRRFMSEADPERKGEAGKDLIRAIFGKDAIAEDPTLQFSAGCLGGHPCSEDRGGR